MNEVFVRFAQLDAAAAACYDPFERAPPGYFSAFRRCLLPRNGSGVVGGQHTMDERVAEYLDGGNMFHSTTEFRCYI
jgi:hypothetical protein